MNLRAVIDSNSCIIGDIEVALDGPQPEQLKGVDSRAIPSEMEGMVDTCIADLAANNERLVVLLERVTKIGEFIHG